MLSGVLVYKDSKFGSLKYKVLARDSFDDLKMMIDVDSDEPCTVEQWNRKIDLFDLNEEGIVPDGYKYGVIPENESLRRRLDIKKTNKYKSTITNREFATRISALIRYMQIAGKQNYNQQADAEFSATRTVDIIVPKTKQKIGTVRYNMGIITDLVCGNKYCEIYLRTISDDNLQESIFKELKEKDKFGKKLYTTPISIVGFKLSEELLGFPYTPEVEKEIPQGFGMYETIEDVIEAHPDKNTAWILKQDYQIVSDENLEQVIQMFMDWDKPIAYDTETSGLNINFKSRTNEADQLVGVVLSRKPGEGYYFPLQHKLFKNLCDGDHFYFMDRYMRPILENKKIICHNLKFDWKVAYIYDINVNCFYDTMLAFGVTKRYEDESFELGLKALTKNIFGRDSFELSDFVMGGSFGDSEIAFWDLPYELVRQYAPADTDNTYALYNFIEENQILQKYDAEKVFAMEITFAKAVAYSEFYGYHINVEHIPELQAKIVGEMERCKAEMFKIAGKEFNPNSPQQLSDIMYNQLHVEQVGEKQSTDKETLKTLASRVDADGNPKYPFVNLIKTYRDNESIYKNFLKRLPEFSTKDGYIFPDVLQIGTNTGRVSVKNPNYQGYNDIVKHYVVPRQDFIHFDCDFAQIEQRVLTSYSCIMFPDEPPLALLKDFDDPDMDYHTYQAARMFNVPYAAVTKSMRQQSKGINFGLPYGMGDSSLGTRIFGERNSENTAKAADLRKKFFAGQELIAKFFEKVRSEGVQNGYTSTQWGRRRYYHKGVFSVAEIRRQAGNHVIQGCILGSTKIKTQDMGVVPIEDAVGYRGKVWNGTDWVHGDVLYSGKKRLCKVVFSDGKVFKCSPTHKFSIINSEDFNNVRISKIEGERKFVECQNLFAGLIVEVDSGEFGESTQKLYKYLNKKDMIVSFGLEVKSVEITDEYTDMYDVCNTDGGYYVADGLITHNTAADIYKTAVNNMFNTICEEGWLGKVLINGFIHDEMLMEVHKSINLYYFFKVWRREFEVHPANYCKLYAGAGVGYCWYDAKKLDLPPLYIDEIINKYQDGMDWDENLDNFLATIKKNFKIHKVNRVKNYILAPENQDQIIKPAVGSLLGEDLEDVLDEIKSDETWINRMNEVLVDNPLTLNGKNKIKGLQNQLKAFCLYYGIDYSTIDIKSVEDVDIAAQQKLSNGPSDFLEEDEISLDIDPQEMLKLRLFNDGVVIDETTRTIHLAEMYIRNKGEYSIKCTQAFIQQKIVVPGDNGYTIMYYPTLKIDSNGQIPCLQIPGYCIPYDQGTFVVKFYRSYQRNNFGKIIRD